MTEFRTLFTLGVSHDYYREGCKDFEFLFPNDAGRLLANTKVLAREREGKLFALFEANEGGPALLSAAGKTLRIGLKLNNPFFSNFTKLDFDPNLVVPLYKNSVNPASLNGPEKVLLVGGLFSHSISDNARPVTVKLRDQNGSIIQTDTITSDVNRNTVSYDVTLLDPGLYSVEEIYPTANGFIFYYSDPQFVRAGVFGLVEIKISKAFYNASPDLKIEFQAKKETLKYYVIAKSYTNTEFNSLSITDAGFNDDGRPQVNFTKVLPASFTANDISPDLLMPTGSKLALFKSQAVVVRSEKARRKIQLKKNNNVLIENLPQPGIEKVNSDLIIQLTKP
jgi:hypothetical protein